MRMKTEINIKPPLRKKIYEALKSEILSNELKAGQIISEESLAKRYGASRTPVREVLSTLGKEGLVQYYPRRGYQVTEFRLDDVLEVFHIRMMLEPEAAYLAASRATSQDVKRLESLAREIASSREHGKVNLRLHRYIAELTGNKLLAELVEQLNEKIWLFGRDYLAFLNPGDSELTHFKIIKALKQRNAEKARDAMREHLEYTQRRISRRIL
jgi:DNA-binding GntR family transcriptional regulator